MKKNEFKMEQVVALWIKESKKGTKYLSGKLGEKWVTGFFNGKKKNPKEPDIRIYEEKEVNGDERMEEIISLWVNESKSGKNYATGKFDGKKVVGFFNAKAKENPKVPYLSVYWSDNKTTNEVPDTKELESMDLPF